MSKTFINKTIWTLP